MNEFPRGPRAAGDEPHDARALARALGLVGRRLEAAERDALKDHGLT
ncbi:MAG: hypothetical protein AVDCRST_MAG79-2155, partial [uncultured Thermoleophilia bacterium]